MKFSIFDGMAIMVLVALAMVGARLQQQTRQLAAQFQQDKQQLLQRTDEINIKTAQRFANQQLAERYRKWQPLIQATRNKFPELQQKYGHIEPVPSRLVLRSLPVIPDPESHLAQWRVSIPEGPPVFLCFGSENQEVDYWKLREHSWSRNTPLRLPGPYACPVSPGLHTVTIAIGPGYSEWKLMLDQQTLLDTSSRRDFTGYSGTGPSVDEPYTFQKDRWPVVLYRYRCLNDQEPPAMDCLFWFDVEAASIAAFPPLPESQGGQQ